MEETTKKVERRDKQVEEQSIDQLEDNSIMFLTSLYTKESITLTRSSEK